EFDVSMRSSVVSDVKTGLREKWRYEVAREFGPEWAATARDNFQTPRDFGRPIEEDCKEQTLEGGRVSYQCRFATAACKEPQVLRSDGTLGDPPPPPQPQTPAPVPSSGGSR